jgi:putative DNA primase/helicase
MQAVNSNVTPFPGKDWKARLARRNKGKGDPYGDERNVMTALDHAPEFFCSLQYDAFSDQIKLLRPPPWPSYAGVDQNDWKPRVWSDNDRIELQAWLQAQSIPVSRAAVVQDSVIAIAQRSEFHPVRIYLDEAAKRWDGTTRIDHWLIDCFGAKDDKRYLQEIGPKFLLGAVARIYEPGCQMDTILVLEGAQGLGKSTAVRELANGWCADLAHDMGSKDAAIHIQGVWFGELSELTALARSQTEIVKGFISRRIDRYRPPYGRNAIDRPRQTVFIATTNECEYLQDATGGRRFWPVDCRTIDIDMLRANRDQLWGEAVTRFRAGHKWHLDKPTEVLAYREQHHRRRVSPMETMVLEYADRMRVQGHIRIEMRGVLRDAVGIETDKAGPASGPVAKEAGRILTSNGWVREKPTGWGKNRTVWYQYQQDRDPLSYFEGSQASLTST